MVALNKSLSQSWMENEDLRLDWLFKEFDAELENWDNNFAHYFPYVTPNIIISTAVFPIVYNNRLDEREITFDERLMVELGINNSEIFDFRIYL